MRRPLCLLCLFYVLGVIFILELFPVSKGEEEQLQNEKMCILSGEVYRMEYKNNKSVLYLKVSDTEIPDTKIPNTKIPNTESPDLRALCYTENQEILSKIKIGNRVTVKGTCRLFEEAAGEGQFDSRLYYRIQGISYFVTGCQVTLEDEGFLPCEQGLFAARRYLSGVLTKSLPPKYAGIMQAVFLGEKGGLDEEIKELFQRNGISHILAISGLHISFLGMGIFRFLKKLRVPSLAGAAFSAIFIISFGIMTGQSASTIRSVIMFLLFLLAGLCGRTYDMLTAAAISGAALLLKQPLYIYHSGFLLSFGAVMGIALLIPAIENVLPKEPAAQAMILNRSKKEKILRSLKRKIRSSLIASLSISLATLPIQLFFFYTFPLYSVFLNLFIIPLMGLLMAAGSAGLFLSCLAPFWGGLFMTPCKWILLVCEGLCRLFDGLPGGNPVLGKPELWQAVIYYGILLWLVFKTKSSEKDFVKEKNLDKKPWEKKVMQKKKLNGKGNILLLMAGVFILCLRLRGATALTMLDIGQGDCMVLEEKSGYNVLVDGGSSDVSEVGRYRIIPFLKSHGISSLDYVFVSHADSDHISGILEILSDDGKERIKIKHLVLTKFAISDPAYEELLAYADIAGAEVLIVSEGDRFEIGDTRWECLYPGINEEGDGNDQSMVLFMECGGIGTLFTGDLPGEREEKVIKRLGQRNIGVLKVAHHGSGYSTTEAFLEGCLPAAALISAGKDNPYGHPHKEVLERLEDTGCRVYGTFSKGAVTIRYGKRKYSVLTYKKM